jgi:SOS-response transcriptional repressor LexA
MGGVCRDEAAEGDAVTHNIRLTSISNCRRILAMEFIRRYFRDFGTSPSFGEIAAAVSIPVQRVGRLLQPLVDNGELLHTPGKPRSLRLPDRAEELSDAEIALVLLRRGWTVNNVDLIALSESVTNIGVSVAARLADRSATAGAGVEYDGGRKRPSESIGAAA